MSQTVTLADREGPLGTITLDGGQLTGSTLPLQRVADRELARTGSAGAAFAALQVLSNGYVWALRPGPEPGSLAPVLRETETANNLAGQLTDLAAWEHELRDEHGRWTGGGGAASGTITHDTGLVSDAHVVSAEAFSQRFEDAFRGSPYAAFVNHYTPEQIRAEHMTPVIAAGGKAGVLIHDHGDGRIEPTGLFNVSDRKGMGLALLRLAIDRHGANYVEAYGPVLNKMYATLGFTDSEVYPFDPSMADPAWDSQRFDSPDYHMMKLPSQLAEPSEDDGLDLDEVRAAAADDPSFSEDAWDAAMAVFGIEHP